MENIAENVEELDAAADGRGGQQQEEDEQMDNLIYSPPTRKGKAHKVVQYLEEMGIPADIIARVERFGVELFVSFDDKFLDTLCGGDPFVSGIIRAAQVALRKHLEEIEKPIGKRMDYHSE